MRHHARTILAATAVLACLAGTAKAAPPTIIFTIHSSASNTFWQAVKKGFDDGCQKIQARCQMVFTQTEGSIEQEIANIQTALARKPDALLTTIVDDHAFDAPLARARQQGITVIGVNADDTQGAAGNAREAFIGQGFIPAGHNLGKAVAQFFPKDGPIRVVVGISSPGQSWSEQRGAGIIRFMEEYKAANPGRDIAWKRLDSAPDLAITADRVGAYLNANPDTTAYFDTGYWDAGVARVLKDRGIAPGKVLLGGFDLVPEVLQQMKAGYIQAHIDQQPYMQGFMGVMEVYLAQTAGIAPANIDTGQGVLLQDGVDKVMKLAREGLR